MKSESLLTRQEQAILHLIASGNTNRKMAEMLHISEFTVETHRKNIHRKLGSCNTATMLMIAFRKGLLEK